MMHLGGIHIRRWKEALNQLEYGLPACLYAGKYEAASVILSLQVHVLARSALVLLPLTFHGPLKRHPAALSAPA